MSSNGKLLPSNRPAQSLILSDGMDLNEIGSMIADRISMDKVAVSQVLAEAMGDFRGEQFTEENIILKETYHPDGKSLASREVIVSQKTGVVRE